MRVTLPATPARPSQAERCQQDTAFEDEVLVVGRCGEAGKKAFQCVESQQLLNIAVGATGELLNSEKRVAGRRSVSRFLDH